MHWAARYIGLPWEAAAEGPHAFNCWTFVRHVQRVYYGRDLPEIPNPEDILRVARAFRDHPERARWPEVEVPRDGDCVLMRQSRHPVHVGVWITGVGYAGAGAVLHCARDSGVVCQTPAALNTNNWHIAGYYRFAPIRPLDPPAASALVRAAA